LLLSDTFVVVSDFMAVVTVDSDAVFAVAAAVFGSKHVTV